MKKKTKTKQNKKSNKVKPKTAKKAKAKQLDRLTASVIALNGIKTRLAYHSAVQKADNIYAGQAGSGKSNLKEAGYSFSKASKVMVLLKMIRIEKGQIIRLKG